MIDTVDFMDFCDQMMIADEKFDLSVLDGFGDGNMILYHASPLKLDEVKPTSWNMGNRLSPRKRKSSFWTKNMEYSILWSLDWVILRVEGIPYIHDIEKYKFYVPDISLYENIGGGVKKKIPIIKFIEKELKENPVYIYKVSVPRAIVSKGQFNIEEYTIDVPIKPEKTYIVTPEIAMPHVQVLDTDTFSRLEKTKIGDTRKRNPSLKERLIYRNPERVIRQRTRKYQREFRSYGHNELASESFFGM